GQFFLVGVVGFQDVQRTGRADSRSRRHENGPFRIVQALQIVFRDDGIRLGVIGVIRRPLIVVGIPRQEQQQGSGGRTDENPFFLPFSAFLPRRQRPVFRIRGPRGDGDRTGLSACPTSRSWLHPRPVPADFFPAAGAPLQMLLVNGLLHRQAVTNVEVRQGTKVFIPQSHVPNPPCLAALCAGRSLFSFSIGPGKSFMNQRVYEKIHRSHSGESMPVTYEITDVWDEGFAPTTALQRVLPSTPVSPGTWYHVILE